MQTTLGRVYFRRYALEGRLLKSSHHYGPRTGWRMIRLVDLETGASLDVEVSALVAQAFRTQVGTDGTSDPNKKLRDRLRYWLADAIARSVSHDLRPPTDKQMLFAAAIARRLGLSLPRDALLYRRAVSDFITQHKDDYIRAQGNM